MSPTRGFRVENGVRLALALVVGLGMGGIGCSDSKNVGTDWSEIEAGLPCFDDSTCPADVSFCDLRTGLCVPLVCEEPTVPCPVGMYCMFGTCQPCTAGQCNPLGDVDEGDRPDQPDNNNDGGPDPCQIVMPDGLDLGSVSLGSCSEYKPITILSNGSGRCEVLNYRFARGSSPEFKIKPEDVRPEGIVITIEPNDTIQVHVQFCREDSVGDASAVFEVTVNSRDPFKEMTVVSQAKGKKWFCATSEPAPHNTMLNWCDGRALETLDFGQVPVNQRKTLSLYVRNDLRAPDDTKVVRVTDFVSVRTGPNADFQINAPREEILLSNGQERAIEITCDPRVPGPHSATLTIGHDDDESGNPRPATVKLKCEGIISQLECLPSAANFGLVDVGSSATKQVCCENKGYVPVTINDLRMENGEPAYVLTPDQAVPSQPIGHGEKFCVDIEFTPYAKAQYDDVMILPTTDPTNPNVRVPVSGLGQDAELLCFPPPPLDFGSVFYNGESECRCSFCVNNGSGYVSVNRVFLDQTSPEHFEICEIRLNGLPIAPPTTSRPANVLSRRDQFEVCVKYKPLGEQDVEHEAAVGIDWVTPAGGGNQVPLDLVGIGGNCGKVQCTGQADGTVVCVDANNPAIRVPCTMSGRGRRCPKGLAAGEIREYETFDVDNQDGINCEYICRPQRVQRVDPQGQPVFDAQGQPIMDLATDYPDMTVIDPQTREIGEDLNCDGIDGDKSRAIFVSTTGQDSNRCGTMDEPCLTLDRGLRRAIQSNPPRDVYMSMGEYSSLSEDGTIRTAKCREGVSIYGLYNAGAGWKRVLGQDTILRGEPDPQNDAVIALECKNIDFLPLTDGTRKPTIIQGMTIKASPAHLPGGSSYAMHIVNAPGLIVEHSKIVAGNGASGLPGTQNGANGRDGVAGRDGEDGREDDQGFLGLGLECSPSREPLPGPGGVSDCGFGGRGGKTCRAKCSACNARDDRGSPGSGGALGGSGGRGRADGQNGERGTSGTRGQPGRGGQAVGVIEGARRLWVCEKGENGLPGGPGGGGAGGGGGGCGGMSCFLGIGNCADWGGGGGGGGAGGCGGQGGQGGGCGGGSFAVFVYDSSPVIRNNIIETGRGGQGGDGRQGGDGGYGVDGGNGGSAYDYCGRGGRGGAGGPGGDGGGGGGGGGGPAVGIYKGTEAANPTLIDNTITMFPGMHGQGGSSSGTGQAGEDGVTCKVYNRGSRTCEVPVQ